MKCNKKLKRIFKLFFLPLLLSLYSLAKENFFFNKLIANENLPTLFVSLLNEIYSILLNDRIKNKSNLL